MSTKKVPQISTAAAGSGRPLIIRLGKRLRGSMNRISAAQSKIPNGSIIEASAFPWTDHLAENWQTIAPATAELVRQIPDLNSAFFSILEPGAVIPRHRGVTHGLVTCHLGLIIPDRPEDCVIQIEDTDCFWETGKWLVFDDSQYHEVHNRTDQRRVILLIQVKRPMRFLGRLANDLAIWGIRRSPFVQDARRNLGHWEEAYRQAEQNEAA